MKEIISILNEIATKMDFHRAIEEGNKEEVNVLSQAYFKKFQEVYEKIDRHMYSEISKYIYDTKGDEFDILSEALHEIISWSEDNYYKEDKRDTPEGKCYLSLKKLYDHIELESTRYDIMNRIQQESERLKKERIKFDELLKNSKDQIDEADKKHKNVYEHLISILGIFAGLVITFSFAITISSGALSNLSGQNFLQIGFIISLLGVVFLNVITLLMMFVAKLTGHSFKNIFPLRIYILSMLTCFILTILFVILSLKKIF